MCPTCGHSPRDHSCEGHHDDGSDFWFCFARVTDADDGYEHACGCSDPRSV